MLNPVRVKTTSHPGYWWSKVQATDAAKAAPLPARSGGVPDQLEAVFPSLTAKLLVPKHGTLPAAFVKLLQGAVVSLQNNLWNCAIPQVVDCQPKI